MSDSSGSNPWDGIKKADLVDSNGLRYREFAQTLTPKYPLVWFHVLCGYVALATTAAALVGLQTNPVLPLPLCTAVGAVLVGFFIYYLNLFVHEAAHFNMAKNRRWNDLATNLLIGPLVGMNLGPYRLTHFDHHRHVGTPRDTEISYFDPLNMRFFVEALLSIKVLRVMAGRNKAHRVQGIGANKRKAVAAYLVLLLSLAIHFSLAACFVYAGWYALAIAWLAGVLSVYPCLGSLRVLLEHRSEDAHKTVDYTQTAHGEVERMFGNAFLARAFGHAGFNRHLLHHWDPGISYTRLKELERYLDDTEFGERVLASARTTYPVIFGKLYNR